VMEERAKVYRERGEGRKEGHVQLQLPFELAPFPFSFLPSPRQDRNETHMLVDEKDGNIWSFCELLEGSFDDGGLRLCGLERTRRKEGREVSLDVERRKRSLCCCSSFSMNESGPDAYTDLVRVPALPPFLLHLHPALSFVETSWPFFKLNSSSSRLLPSLPCPSLPQQPTLVLTLGRDQEVLSSLIDIPYSSE